LMPRKGPFTLTLSIASRFSTAISSMVWRMLMAALLTRMSSLRLLSTTTAKACFRLSSEPTSRLRNQALGPVRAKAGCKLLAFGFLQVADIDVRAFGEEALGDSLADALAAPVTRAILFSKRIWLSSASRLEIIGEFRNIVKENRALSFSA
jgi:hypothetical protein